MCAESDCKCYAAMIKGTYIFNLHAGHNTKSQYITQNTKPEGKLVEYNESTLLDSESEPREP